MSEEEKKDEKTAEQQAAAEPAAKKKKWPVVVGIVVVVIAVAGIGFWNWHATPGFCNSMCHESMDAYVETYDNVAGQAGVDKYGNAVSNSSAMMVVAHKEANVACLDCHVPSITQQLGEVMETITGNYYVVNRNDGKGFALEEVDQEPLMVNSGHAEGTGDQFCLKSGCHDMTRADLTAATANMERNPHSWQHGEEACTTCHKSHRASVLYCTQCHSDAVDELPDGWVTYEQGKKLVPTE